MKFSAILCLSALAVLSAATAPTESSPSSAQCAHLGHEIRTVESNIATPDKFCTWYLSETREHSPLKHLGADVLPTICRCILRAADLPDPPLGAKPNGVKTPEQCNRTYAKAIRGNFYEPREFCRFYGLSHRVSSPIKGLTSRQVSQGCACIEPMASSVITTSTKKKHPKKPMSTSDSSDTSVSWMATDSADAALATMAPYTTIPSSSTSPTPSCTLSVDASLTSSYGGQNFTYTSEYEAYGSTVEYTIDYAVSYPLSIGLPEALSSCIEMVAGETTSGYWTDMGLFANTTSNQWICGLYYEDNTIYPNRTDFVLAPAADIACSFFYNQVTEAH
ncbi:hypothetical protein ANO11243_034980 [Dothideomycetidae sp. 11243]|nr:hypothetical protein ANO11243_034980 [fungal sp. No.11243]